MTKRKIGFLKMLPILVACNFSFAQIEKTKNRWSEYNIVNLSYQHSGIDFLSIQVGKIREHQLYNIIDANLKLGYSLRDDYFNIGCNAHYNFFYFLSLGTSIDYYPSFGKKGLFSIRPEIGISPFGLFSIYYGFSFDSDNSNLMIQNHNLTVSLQIGLFDKSGFSWFTVFNK